MLLRGRDFMAKQQIPIELVLGDATRLPFMSETYDVVLNYGALNGYTDSKAALDEAARVTKKRRTWFFSWMNSCTNQPLWLRRFISSEYYQVIMSFITPG